MKQLLSLVLLAAFIMGTGFGTAASYAAEEQSTEKPKCEGEDCPAEEEPECD
ncbi:MAG: hypothetical protein OQK25_01560 [Gammaproteobacteria bacterium]|nr:hypothetical protein [Gammaproteobacteria bacterium]